MGHCIAVRSFDRISAQRIGLSPYPQADPVTFRRPGDRVGHWTRVIATRPAAPFGETGHQSASVKIGLIRVRRRHIASVIVR